MGIFEKYEGNPVFGNAETGTMFDAYISRCGELYRMDFSYRKMKSCAVAFSSDGINWSEPHITLAPNPNSGFEDRISRNCVLFIDGVYKMWYTGQARGYSFIGVAESEDGLNFHRVSDEPVLVPEFPWEKESVMNPCVLYENGKYRMWYSAGETYEPNVLAYAESDDGVNFKKRKANPIFVRDPENKYEQERIGGCQVIKTDDMGYLMFYIGYEDINTARICVARSDNGITGWERSPFNPIIEPEAGKWDGDACYKPTVIPYGDGWRLWYNGRLGNLEFIGLSECKKRDLFGE